MKYKVDICELVKQELVKENIDNKTINKIKEVVKRVLVSNWCRIPQLNALQFDQVVNGKNGPLKVLFNSSFL